MRRQVSLTMAVPVRGLAVFLFAGMGTDWTVADTGEYAHGIFGGRHAGFHTTHHAVFSPPPGWFADWSALPH